MCGIVGALIFGQDHPQEDSRQEVARILTTELMLLTEKRGEDATGAAILFDSGDFYGIKRGSKSSEFLSKFKNSSTQTKDDTYGSILKVWRKYKNGRVFIGHCRQGTGGSKFNNANNHPIKVDNLVGVHNGSLKNCDIIFRNLGCKRDGEVDSEAIFRLAAHFTNNGKEPFTIENVKNVAERLDGAFSVIMFNGDNPFQVPVFRDGRPMEFVFVKDLGLLFIISEQVFWNQAMFTYERIVRYYNKRLPSLIGMDIEKGLLAENTVGLFDLTINVSVETNINNLCETTKLTWGDRKWRSAATHTTTTANVGYVGNTEYYKHLKEGKAVDNKSVDNKLTVVDSKTNTNTTNVTNTHKEEPNDSKEYMVFDKVKQQYVLSKDLSKEIQKEIHTVIELDNDRSTNDILETSQEDKDTIESTSAVVESVIVDLTEYTTKNKELPVVYVSDVNNVDKYNTEVVDMTPIQPQIFEEADKTYKELPIDERGFNNINQVLDATEIASEEAMKRFGITLTCNRVFKYAWIRGFMKCLSIMNNKNNSVSRIKDIKREKHIVNLKAITVMLARFLSFAKITYQKFGKDVEFVDDVVWARILPTTLKVDSSTIVDLEPIFNSWEVDSLQDFKNVMKESEGKVGVEYPNVDNVNTNVKEG